MSIETFDGVTAPALPSTMTFAGGLVTAANASTYGVSAPNTLTLAATGTNNHYFATYLTDDGLGGNVHVTCFFNASGQTNRLAWGLTARASATSISASSGTFYWLVLDLFNLEFVLYSASAGTLTPLGVVTFSSFAAPPSLYVLQLSCYGTSIRASAISGFEVTYQYLQPGGTWSSTVADAISVADSSIPAAAGYWGCTVQNRSDTVATADSVGLESAPMPLPGTVPRVYRVPAQYSPAWQF